ncbi:PucR family transcriptional regulator [Nocardia cyriacigeorgica]|uniref:PucR family transcriptional regulator n=1 Tax=Nocardia cyriacigeorgica TaxID=135487 RepID=UPI003EE0ADED
MEALATRLSGLDAHAEGAIRVITFYDTLMRRRVDLTALVRASAGLAECAVGGHLHSTGRTTRISPAGAESADSPVRMSSSVPVTLDEEVIGTAWLERPGAPIPLDEVLLERLAIAVAAVVERYGPARTIMADPALVELVISAECEEAERARALRLLGFAAGLRLQVLAVRSPVPLDRLSARLCGDHPVKAAQIADVGVILTSAVDQAPPVTDLRAGVGAAENPVRSWRQARTALRFATARRPVVHYRELGALALLAEVPRETAAGNTDVAAIASIAATPDDLETLEVYCETGSLRRAAELLHRHHSSIARRLDRLGTALGFDLTEPSGMLRARLAITMWRLLDE